MNKLRLLIIILSVTILPTILGINIYGQLTPVATWSWTAESSSDNTRGTINISVKIADGFHIYGMEAIEDGPVPTQIVFNKAPGINIEGSMTASVEPENKYESVFGAELQLWSDSVTFSQPFIISDLSAVSEINGYIRYMACNDDSCTPAQTVPFLLRCFMGENGEFVFETVTEFDEDTADAILAASLERGEDKDFYAPVNVNENSSENSAWWYLLVMGFVGGIIALLTPCVWPMIPMTVSFFLKKGGNKTKSIRDAIVYALSIIIIYVILGLAITVIFGASTLNSLATSAVFNLIFFVLLLVFAISFFGAFDIKLPSRWSNKMDSMAEKTSGYLSIFFMAFTLALVSFSCTGPIIGTLLVEAASNQSLAGPAIGMTGFALGLAIPFGLFAFFPSLLKEMPKSGGWMNSVKVVLGFIELILSLKFLSVADMAYGWGILNRDVFLAIWIVLFILLGMYLLGKLRFPHDTPREHTGVFSFFLAVISFSFAVYMIPGLWGAPLKSISAFAPPLSTQSFNLYQEEVAEFEDYDEAMLYARENNLPVMVDFSGYGCVNCRKMEGSVFDTRKVRELITTKYVFVKLMVDDRTPLAEPYTIEENGKNRKIKTLGDKWSYLQRHKFGTNSQPFYVLLDNDGDILTEPRKYNENVDEFVEWLEEGLEIFETSPAN